jgi:hypothetical protein
MKRLVAAGGWTTPSTPPCSHWPGCSPLAAGLAAASSEVCAARSGCTSDWSRYWFCRITSGRGVASAAGLHFWSASVSALPPGAALNENDWIGRTILIGDTVRLAITEPCPRCVMITLPQGDLPKDSGILRTAAQHNAVNVGVYASVINGGTIHRGDPVVLA